jgi:site-specific recombinase XerD
MGSDLAIPSPAAAIAPAGSFLLPAVIADQGDKAAERFLTFFTDQLPNAHTRAAYHRNALRFFAWVDAQGLRLPAIRSYHVSAYLADLATDHATPTVKQHLASLRMLFDWLILGQVIDANPAAAVRAAKHVVKKGKTPVLTADEARQLLDSIPLKIGAPPQPGEPDNRPPCLIGLRDRALIGVMVYSFARISAALGMKVEDYYTEGRRAWFRLHEKGGKRHEVPAHHNAEAYVDTYLEAAGIGQEKKSPLFRSAAGKTGKLTDRPMHRVDAIRMVKRRAQAAGLSDAIGNHTFRATGITAYLEEGGTIEHAQRIANHESPKTTKLYDRTGDSIDLDEIERIRI